MRLTGYRWVLSEQRPCARYLPPLHAEDQCRPRWYLQVYWRWVLLILASCCSESPSFSFLCLFINSSLCILHRSPPSPLYPITFPPTPPLTPYLQLVLDRPSQLQMHPGVEYTIVTRNIRSPTKQARRIHIRSLLALPLKKKKKKSLTPLPCGTSHPSSSDIKE